MVFKGSHTNRSITLPNFAIHRYNNIFFRHLPTNVASQDTYLLRVRTEAISDEKKFDQVSFFAEQSILIFHYEACSSFRWNLFPPGSSSLGQITNFKCQSAKTRISRNRGK